MQTLRREEKPGMNAAPSESKLLTWDLRATGMAKSFLRVRPKDSKPSSGDQAQLTPFVKMSTMGFSDQMLISFGGLVPPRDCPSKD